MPTVTAFATARCNFVATAGLPFVADLVVGSGTTDFSTGYTIHLNIGNPDVPTTPLIATATAPQVTGFLGYVHVALSASDTLALPKRPCPYQVWAVAVADGSLVPIAKGRIVFQTLPGSG